MTTTPTYEVEVQMTHGWMLYPGKRDMTIGEARTLAETIFGGTMTTQIVEVTRRPVEIRQGTES